MSTSGTIRTGIGGWTFEPWEGTFYPEKLPKKRQLEHASRQLTAIEVNGTYYSSQKPETFAKWASEVPEDFVFSLKASRFVTNRRVLAEAGESMMKFLTQGLTELGSHLGPILWQFAPTKKFDAEDFGAFLSLLPEKQDGIRLRHVVEVRNPTFQVPEFIDLLAKHKVAVVCADHHDYPMLPDVTADFVYCRLQKGEDDIKTCYPKKEIDHWAERVKTYAKGGVPDDLPLIAPERKVEMTPRDVFAFFITGGKVNAPNGAQELQKAV
ncbi:DUF72 domain-containing protein [Agrobacterium tumefaciens]|uniref:DUF72 domain-containing protein n=1 Tax=Agrobacterium tumefaciens TaxID=358 RepID=A0AAP9E3J5_AGRTU|nr:DUF72 domain-containing protein [Agrobacterium tumefaciens]MBP2564914.1 uncharacterized protein YecE (DUF72 family) [Agrobacterium tumefaciens]MDR6701221.1 uncharacterized protein YecE (DUF72 family) [Agrobacterium tumefaciens]NSZ57561.1 DUF72 domain-containing protein [Agrobacterium tumefaciens]QDY93695.1 DUF72 domain-containing protein [Agrobacterium tumefaciens]TCV52201.1 uncharacterized protein YecE (DUF72 family) [Agrobacterium tumefaciens]